MQPGPETPIEADTQEEYDDEFYIYKAKIELCPRQDAHSYSTCPYLHPNELAQRRDPQLFKYDSIFCYDLHHTKSCRRGIHCPYSHNLFEYFLHPNRYRTRMCEHGQNCTRELCFFAHNEQQLRQRTAIKTHSGGRRSGKQHRAAMAVRAAVAAAAAGSDQAGSSSSLQQPLHMQQMPPPPPPPTAGNSAQQLSIETPEALARLSLAADSTIQLDSGGAVGAPAAPPVVQEPQWHSEPLMMMRQLSGMSPADLLRSLSCDTAAAQVGGNRAPLYHHSSPGNQGGSMPLYAGGGVEPGTVVMPGRQVVMQGSHTPHILSGGSSATLQQAPWAVLPHQQQHQHHHQQQQVVLLQQQQHHHHQHALHAHHALHLQQQSQQLPVLQQRQVQLVAVPADSSGVGPAGAYQYTGPSSDTPLLPPQGLDGMCHPYLTDQLGGTVLSSHATLATAENPAAAGGAQHFVPQFLPSGICAPMSTQPLMIFLSQQ